MHKCCVRGCAEVLKIPATGADIHWPVICNRPNRGDAEVSVQCGGNAGGGHVRPVWGTVLGLTRAVPVAQVRCPACNSLNHARRFPRCQNVAPLGEAANLRGARSGKVPAPSKGSCIHIAALA